MTEFTKPQIVEAFGNFHENMDPSWVRIQDRETGQEKDIAQEGDSFNCWGDHFRVIGNITDGKVGFSWDEA